MEILFAVEVAAAIARPARPQAMPGCRTWPKLWGALLAGAVLLPRTAGATDDDSTLETVVVTAQKHSQDVQQIGIAVTTVSGEDLEALRLQQPLDLSTVSASLSTMNATTDSTPLFLLRGIGLDDFNMNNSSGVGTYQDEVFASFPGFLTGVLYDVDRVEILKGPQGTLYGRNTAGGAINIVARRPTDLFEGYVAVDASRWRTVEVNGAVSGPLTDTVRARLAATVTEQGEGYQTDIDTGARYGKLDRGGARSLFDIRLGGADRLELNVHTVFDHSIPASPSTPDVESLVPPHLPFPTAGRLDSPAGGTLVRVGGLPLHKDESGAGASARLDMHGSGTTFTSITAYDYFSDHSLDNYDGYPAADNNWTKNFQQWQFSEELRLASVTGGPINWIVGAQLAWNGYHCGDALDWTFVYGLADFITDAGKAITAAHFTQTQRSQGLFAHAESHLSPRWDLVTGLRYSRDDVAFDGTTIDPTGLLSFAGNGFAGPVVPGRVLAALDQARSSQNVSYRLEPDFHVSDSMLIYASLASGYKGGVFYGQPAQVQVDWGYVNPEEELAAELGMKSRFFGNALEVDAALFDTDIRNRQSSLSLWAGPAGTQPLIAGLGNVPRARIDGVETDVKWLLLPGLEARLSASLLRARVTQTLTSDNGLALFTPVQVGQMLPDAPNFSGSWILRYERAVGGMARAYAQVNDRYTGPEHPYLGDPTTFGSGHCMGARVGLRDAPRQWEASLWVTNLADTRPLTYAFAGSEGQRVSYYQKPRSVGLSLRYDF